MVVRTGHKLSKYDNMSKSCAVCHAYLSKPCSPMCKVQVKFDKARYPKLLLKAAVQARQLLELCVESLGPDPTKNLWPMAAPGMLNMMR